ncbi:MAG: type IV toxin-antitoxin system AbiEi family antitoxin domain-containing protein [Mycobacteriales bacterium]
MRSEIRRLLDRNGGIVRRADLTAAVPKHVVDWALTSGQVVRVAPEVYADPAVLGQPMTTLRTALRYGGENAALSHTTGLSLWELPLPPGLPVHLMTDSRQLHVDPSSVVHRDAASAPSRRWSSPGPGWPSYGWRTASWTVGRC